MIHVHRTSPHKKDDDAYIYFAKTIGALSPDHPEDKEQEYSVVGSVDADDIVAYRKLEKGKMLGQSIFVSNEFIKKYPDKLEQLLKACCYPQESFAASLLAFRETHLTPKLK